MAKSNSKSATKSTGRRGRPTNAERAVRAQSAAEGLVNVAAAAYSAGLRQGLGLPSDDSGSTVTTIASIAGTQQTSQASQPATQTQSAPKAKAAPKAARAPRATGSSSGRPVNPESKMTLTRNLYHENLQASNPLNRADLVKAAAKKFGYSAATGNTYISNIDKENGRQLVRRGQADTQRTGTNG